VLPKWWPKIAKRNMIVTGAAAGLAAAFNTPLGGIVFAIEELTKTHFSYFKTAIFSSVIIAGLTAQAFLGPYLYLGYPKIDNLSPYIFSGVLLVAIISGLLGSSMSKLILVIFAWKAKV
jgi:H+/Cl- antiporter ClcA